MITFAAWILWLVITGVIIYYAYSVIKRRKQEVRDYHDLRNALGDEFDPKEHSPPKPFLQALVMSRAFWTTLFWAFTTAGFMMFIVEETMQVRGFGRYGLQQGKLWQEAAVAANYSVGALTRDRGIIRVLSVLNPPAGYVFKRYVDAEEKKLGWEMKRIESELKKLKSRVRIVENRLQLNPISVLPTKLTDIGHLSKLTAPEAKLFYPKQVDYQTHDKRVKRVKDQVYVTLYGSKYHRGTCSALRGRNGVRKLPESEAVGEGKTPCLRCKP